jgi:hypothetical protein
MTDKEFQSCCSKAGWRRKPVRIKVLYSKVIFEVRNLNQMSVMGLWQNIVRYRFYRFYLCCKGCLKCLPVIYNNDQSRFKLTPDIVYALDRGHSCAKVHFGHTVSAREIYNIRGNCQPWLITHAR